MASNIIEYIGDAVMRYHRNDDVCVVNQLRRHMKDGSQSTSLMLSRTFTKCEGCKCTLLKELGLKFDCMPRYNRLCYRHCAMCTMTYCKDWKCDCGKDHSCATRLMKRCVICDVNVCDKCTSDVSEVICSKDCAYVNTQITKIKDKRPNL